MKTFTHTFEISDEAYALLLSIQKEGYAEYRDTRYESLEDYLSYYKDYEEINNFRPTSKNSIQRFLVRNHGGTYHLTGDLLKYNLIDLVEDSWHITYKLTDFAEEMLSLQSVRNEKLIEILK